MASSTKTIRYSLKQNKLQGQDSAPYTARVQSGRTVGQDEIIATMAKMNASVSRQETLVVLDLMKDVITDILLAGNRAATDLFNVGVSLGGGFETAEDEYSGDRHAVNVRISPAAGLKKAVAHTARFERIRSDEPLPKVDRVYDHGTQSVNSSVSPGQTAEIKGVNLDFDHSDEAQGVFFVNADTNAAVPAQVIHNASGTRVAFRVPSLVQGSYSLVLRRAFGSEIRQGALKAPVSVN
jgi:hypothetical protein